MSNYDEILAELRGRRAAANSSLMQGALDRAIALTDDSHKVLEHLENQRGLLLGPVVEKPLEENDVFKQAVALVNALEELEEPLRARLQSSVRSARGPAAIAPTGVVDRSNEPLAHLRLALIGREPTWHVGPTST